ncbi:MAG: hypothetical protein ACXAC5_07690 [Promethearchaeota archaeon]|jgi:hypothetical protein
MVKTVKGKLRYGPYCGLIGGLLLIIGSALGYLGVVFLSNMHRIEVGINLTLTLLFGIVGFIGAILAFVRKDSGNLLMVIIGLIAVIGTFIPIGSIFYAADEIIPLWLSGSLVGRFLFVPLDPILILIGGILAFIIKEEKESEIIFNV